MLLCVWSNFCQDGKCLEGFGLDQPKQLSIACVVRNWYKRLTWSIMVPQKQNYSQGLDSRVETTGFDAIGHHVKKSKSGACEQKAATVLPNRTAAT